MNEISCLERIQIVYPQFTPVERKVADFVMQHPEKVIYMSINELADAVGVGYTSVFRFCKTMKLDGYQQFKTLLSLGMEKENINIGSKSLDKNEKSFSFRADRILESSITALNITYRQLKEPEFNKMIDYLIHAPHIYFYGVGLSSTVGRIGLARFLQIFPRTCHFEDPYMQIMSATILREDDVAIIISYSGATKDSIEIAKIAHSTGAHVIVITRFANSPITQYAETILLCGDSPANLETNSLSSCISMLYILELIYDECYKRRFAISSIIDGRMKAALADKEYNDSKKKEPSSNS